MAWGGCSAVEIAVTTYGDLLCFMYFPTPNFGCGRERFVSSLFPILAPSLLTIQIKLKNKCHWLAAPTYANKHHCRHNSIQLTHNNN